MKNLLNDIKNIIKTDEDTERLTLKSIINNSVNGQYMITFIVAILIMCPIPVLSTVFGIINVIISYQMLIGRKTIKLPKKLLYLSVNKSTITNLIEKMSPYINKVEILTKNRLIFFTNKKLVNFMIFSASLLSVSPVPFLSVFAVTSMCLTIFGYLNKDGLFIILGIIFFMINFAMQLVFLIVGKVIFFKIINSLFN